MSNKKKLLLFLVFTVVGIALIPFFSSIISTDEWGFLLIIPMIIPALVYALLYEKFDFCRSRWKSVLCHILIWLVIDVILTLIAYRNSIDRYPDEHHFSIATVLPLGLCVWLSMVVMSLVFIAIKKTILRKTGRTESDRMAKEIMQRNTESNFKEKNDV